MAKKTCNKCGKTKPTTEFHPHPSTHDRLLPKCKACKNRQSRERRQKMKEAGNPDKGGTTPPRKRPVFVKRCEDCDVDLTATPNRTYSLDGATVCYTCRRKRICAFTGPA